MPAAVTIRKPPKNRRSEYDFKFSLGHKAKRYTAKQHSELLDYLLGETAGGPTHKVIYDREAARTGNFFLEFARVKKVIPDKGMDLYGMDATRNVLRDEELTAAVKAQTVTGFVYCDERGIRTRFAARKPPSEEMRWERPSLKADVAVTAVQGRLFVEANVSTGEVALVELSGISIWTADRLDMVTGEAVLSLPREAVFALFVRLMKEHPEYVWEKSGDGGLTRGLRVPCLDLWRCAAGELKAADCDVPFEEPERERALVA